MKIEQMISKWRMKLAEQNGQTGIMAYGKVTAKQREMITAAKPKIIAELQRRAEVRATKEAKEKAEAEEEKRALLNNEKPIEPKYHDGKYLCGYIVHGYAAELLVSLGLAGYVDGWGYHVGDNVVEALGKAFTYTQAAEY
ncbi:MAG: hypothetical protein GX335_09690, partial [Firmicutes bacterium]|nr:hypothetical protein [Bacillota bacterium]